jgi:hypothetical protein
MADCPQEFSFIDGGHEFSCVIELSRVAGRPAMWWFTVSTDTRQQRYAPFPFDATDTKDNVRQRILEYYDRQLANRPLPAEGHWQQSRGMRPFRSTAGSR